MPLFFFDMDDDGKLARDTEGTVLEDILHARAEAIETLAQIARDKIPGDGEQRNLAVRVTDAEHRPLFAVRIDFHVEDEVH